MVIGLSSLISQLNAIHFYLFLLNHTGMRAKFRFINSCNFQVSQMRGKDTRDRKLSKPSHWFPPCWAVAPIKIFPWITDWIWHRILFYGLISWYKRIEQGSSSKFIPSLLNSTNSQKDLAQAHNREAGKLAYYFCWLVQFVSENPGGARPVITPGLVQPWVK